MRRQLVDYSGEDARQLRDEILRRYPGHARQVVDCIRSEGLMQLIRRDRLVLPGPDPRVDHVAMPVLLEPLHQAAQTAEKAALRLAGRRLRYLRLVRPGDWFGGVTPLPPRRPLRPPVARAASKAVAAIISGLAKPPPGTAEPRTSSRSPI